MGEQGLVGDGDGDRAGESGGKKPGVDTVAALQVSI